MLQGSDYVARAESQIVVEFSSGDRPPHFALIQTACGELTDTNTIQNNDSCRQHFK
jgi:hypothetical protein